MRCRNEWGIILWGLEGNEFVWDVEVSGGVAGRWTSHYRQ
jgi:hypothetical protein